MEKSFKEKVKLITIARTLSLDSGYCPEYEDIKDDYQDELRFSVSKEEVKEACDNWSGNSEDEIVNALERLFPK